MKNSYIFTSDRLGFRNWVEEDLHLFSEMNVDKEVMQYFPKPLNGSESKEFMERLKLHFDTYDFTYFAVEELRHQKFMGFIGMMVNNDIPDQASAIDIGWRLLPAFWNKGYATEGAKRCVRFGFKELGLKEIIAVCPEQNSASEKVMINIGMTKSGSFKHPKLSDYPKIEKCYLYRLENSEIK